MSLKKENGAKQDRVKANGMRLDGVEEARSPGNIPRLISSYQERAWEHCDFFSICDCGGVAITVLGPHSFQSYPSTSTPSGPGLFTSIPSSPALAL